MNKETALLAENISKKFTTSLPLSMRHGIADISRDIFGIRGRSDVLRSGEFWAVDNVSLELKRGERLGIVGPNGSGKSTMLKLLNGIINPDRGRIAVRGRVGALIEVGAGFHPMLTGRENIYVNGSILGMSKAEISAKFDSIVEFAGISKFLEMPVKNYSSGMYVRLGFAVAAHCEPEILLVDEVLSVGDISFQQKCFRYFEDAVINKGVTMILVSHSIYAISRMCSRGILMNSGKMEFSGDIVGLTAKYFEAMRRDRLALANEVGDSRYVRQGAGQLRLESLELRNSNGGPIEKISSGQGLLVDMSLRASRDFESVPGITVKILDLSNTLMAITQVPLAVRRSMRLARGQRRLTCHFDGINLMPGTYVFQVKIGGGNDLIQDNVLNAATLEVTGDDSLYLSSEGYGMVFLSNQWQA